MYAYVDGADLSDVAEPIEHQLRAFVAAERWSGVPPIVINQRTPESTVHAGDFPNWDVGLNLVLPDPEAEHPGWFRDIELIARFTGRLHAIFGRDFVLGISDNMTGISEDLYFVETDVPDVSKLRNVIGVGNVFRKP